jgi:two-component system LytT family sensor kinase
VNRPRVGATVVGVLGAWTLLGAVSLAQLYSSVVDGHHTFTIRRAFELGMENAWLKGLVSLPVIWVLSRLESQSRPVVLRLAAYLGLLAGFIVVHFGIRPAIVPIQVVGGGVLSASYGQQFQTELLSFTADDVLAFALTVAGFHAWRYASEATARARAEDVLRAQLASAELSVLKLQLQPHFLFNALHTIHGLAAEDGPKAQAMVERLGGLLRLSLDHLSSNAVPLRRELEFLDAYLGIELVRFADRLRVTQSIHPETFEAELPSMILQPLVENAIRHGVGRLADGGQVGIYAARAGDRLTIVITNDYRRTTEQPVASGLGLSNTRARLKQMFGIDDALRVEMLPREVRVTIDVPYRQATS